MGQTHWSRSRRSASFRTILASSATSQFLDLADVMEIQIDRITVAELARFDLFSAKSRRAFLAPNPLAYGMSRMFMAFREANGEEQMRVFTDRHEGLR
jgi:hypothetical protein